MRNKHNIYTVLTLWDIDKAGKPNNPACLVEVDKPYLNSTYLGNLNCQKLSTVI